MDLADYHAEKPTFGGFKPAVGDSPDLQRILKIDRRPVVEPDSVKGLALAELMTRRLSRERKDKCACADRCVTKLRPIQAWALYEAPLAGGCLGLIGVGHGKTILNLLTPLVFPGCKMAVLLIPPGLKKQLVRDYLALREHFKVPSLRVGLREGWIVPGAPILHVVPYSLFSRAGSASILEELKPDLIIADEAHKLRYKQTATTARVLRYLSANDSCRLCDWSGTITAKSIKDYAHLLAFSHGEKSPLPLKFDVLESWASALDPSEFQAPAGALKRLCAPGETVQEGFHRRLVETLGVVSTKASPVDASLYLVERPAPKIPAKVEAALDDLRSRWVRGDGEELIQALDVARCAKELACGFYYRWIFPRGEARAVIDRWLSVRKSWHKELREKLKFRRENLDSPLLCEQAAKRFFDRYKGPLPVWETEFYKEWLEVKDTVQPQTEAVWIDDFLARDCASWGAKERGVIWYEHEAFGLKVSELSGLPKHAGGLGAEAKILGEKGDRSIVASIKAHGTGRDGLQRLFNAQLVANPPTSGATWEQLLGRLHRIGQEKDDVTTHVYRHTPEFAEAIDSALDQARYIEGTLGTLQKLLLASTDFTSRFDKQKQGS